VKTIPVLLLIAAAASAQKPPAPLPPVLYATFNTSEGTIVATLYEKYTPESVKNFVGLAQGTKAWRGKMIQSGDPTGTSAHNCGVTVHDEFVVGLQFDHAGRLAVANSGAPDSGACQFFITADLSPESNQKYTAIERIEKTAKH